ncbi:MAG: glycerol kinase GlpK [Saprospiraceae bacterium]|nr:glycerol kinase GlpK [Saprospiraceae bacterium]
MNPEDKYILALDQGTTSSRSLLIDKYGQVAATSQLEFTQIFPQPGWVEHNAEEIWQSQYHTILEVLDKAGKGLDKVACIGITNQRETTVVWDRISGKPIYNAIVWQDRRTSAWCQELIDKGYSAAIQERTGLIIDAYFSASKIRWILDNVPGASLKAQQGELAFGTIDSWLIWKLTQGKKHLTDVTNASRTMLYNIHRLEWDISLLTMFGIPESMLPTVVPSSHLSANAEIGGVVIPISGIAGDQQAALFGQLCLEPGMVKNTYGTGCFMLMNTGLNAVHSQNNLLTTIAWQINGHTFYALEGSVFIGGAVVQWLRDGLKMIEDAPKVEKLALMAPENEGVYFVPAFTGLGAPYWNQEARGSMYGITRGTTQSHIARAALESIAYQTFDVLNAMERDSGTSLTVLKVDGGATKNALLMQFQSDILECDLVVPSNSETTAMGAAYLAGLATGFWPSIEDIKSMVRPARVYHSNLENEKRSALLDGWHRAVRATIEWTKKI